MKCTVPFAVAPLVGLSVAEAIGIEAIVELAAGVVVDMLLQPAAIAAVIVSVSSRFMLPPLACSTADCMR
jgi:hypothetical protein